MTWMLLFCSVLFLSAPTDACASEPPPTFDHGYADWDATLRKHVDAAGRVNYAAVAKDPAFDRFVTSVAGVSAEDVNGWTRDRQVAFWINAYNALTFQTILDAKIPASIRDIKPDPWENARWSVGGRTLSLNWIEHTKLRGQLKEPRVHFVLVCAAVGCPTLPNRAVQPEGLDAQLERFTRTFFQDATKNRLDRASKTVHLSRILDWYGQDFVGAEATPDVPGSEALGSKEGAVLRYFARYASEGERAILAGGGFTVAFNEYDWSLNRQ